MQGMCLCKGCFFLYLGGIISATTIFVKPTLFARFNLLTFIIALLTITLSNPMIYDGFDRRFKNLLRFLLGGIFPLIVFYIFIGHYLNAIIVSGLIIAAKIYYAHLQARYKNNVCINCEEFHTKDICSGFKPKEESMRKFENYLKDNRYDS